MLPHDDATPPRTTGDDPQSTPDFLSGGGEAGALMRGRDWISSPLGPPLEWPQPLKTLVCIMLGSNQPMYVAWGAERTLLYNDAYALILAGKHPEAMGRDVLDVWHEIRADLCPIVDEAYAGRPVHMDDIQFLLERRGYAEEAHFSFFFAPVRDEAGTVAGLYCACTETTGQVLGERARRAAEAALRRSEGRLRFMSRLDEAMRAAADAPAAMLAAAEALATELGASRCAYADVDADSDRFFIRDDFRAPGVATSAGTYSLDLFGPRAAAEMRTGLTLVIRDVEGELSLGEGREMFQAIGINAIVCCPLVKNDRLVAMMAVHQVAPREWTDEEISLVQAVVERCWSHVERVGAEARLRESEARFHAIANSIDQMVWSTRPDGFHDYYNQRWYDFTGVPSGSTDGDAWNGMFHPGDQERARVRWQHSLDTGEPYEIEYRLRHRTGEYRWVLGRAQCVRDDQGRITRWFGTCTDIQEIVEAREVLARSREESEAEVAARSAERDRLWNLSQDMLARADYAGMMSAISPAWTRVLGWSEVELVTRPYATFMHPEDMPPTLEAIELMAETRQPSRFENRIATRDSGWKHIEWTVAPEPDGVNFIAVGRDLSDAKAREAELEVAQEALRQSQKMEAMGSLTGGVAHDFNNLLTPIVGSLDLLQRKGIGSERERRLIDGALQSAERAKTLVQRLLAFARRQPLQPTPVDLARLVEGMAGLIGSTLGPIIDVRVELAADLPPAKADPNQLEMALLNLAVNARDAMPDGGELTIAARRESVRTQQSLQLKPGHYVRLSVLDTGMGMDEATLSRAVEPFFSTKGIGRGTGLGLSMVHGLAAQLGGGLTIESAPGEGTTINLWLPISLAVADGDEQTVEAPPVPEVLGTALLVDDEELVRMSTADMLTDFGYEVREAGSAEEALQLVRAGLKPDLLVTDHLMPGMTGAQLARELRTGRPDLPVLIVSGYAEAEGVDVELPRLTKPFRNAELAASLSALLPVSAG